MLTEEELVSKIEKELVNKFIFEIMDDFIIERVKYEIRTYLLLLRERQEYTNPFQVICDKTNNTPESLSEGYIRWDVLFNDSGEIKRGGGFLNAY